MEKYELIPFGLSIEDIFKLSKASCDISLSSELKERVKKSRKLWNKFFKEEYVIFNDIRIKIEDYISPEETRAIMLLQAYTLALGYSGVRIEVIEKILEFLRKDIIPLIPEGVSLRKKFNPLIFIVYALSGKGEVLCRNKRMTTEEALINSNIKPVKLDKKEVLALTSGTQYLSGILSLYFIKIRELGKISEISVALFLEVLKIDDRFLNPFIQALKPHLGLIKYYDNLRRLLSESEIIFSHSNNSKLPDTRILDYTSQIFFIFHQTLDFVKNILEVEINSISNSPLVVPEEELILNKNLYIETLIHTIDYLSIVITSITCLLEKIVSKIQSVFEIDLPFFYNICQKLAKENKKLSKPLSNNISYSNSYDFLKLEIKNLIKLKRIVKNWEKLIAISLIYEIQCIDYHKLLKYGKGTKIVYQFIKSLISTIKNEEDLHKIQILEENFDNLINHVEEVIGELL
ncbi:MAG: aromatic amino acid ammonia-lyase [Dictyoglomaceae bacterium]|nr:aromatic amino acid ammonia-lyase [Dictyoglomaceae bacterium]